MLVQNRIDFEHRDGHNATIAGMPSKDFIDPSNVLFFCKIIFNV